MKMNLLLQSFPMRLSSALLLLLLLPWSLHAQEGLSLQQCLAYAKTNHLSVQMATNEVVSTKERVGEGLALFMPQVNGSFSFDDNLKRPTTIIPAGVFSPQEIQIQFGNQFTTNAVVQLDQLIYDQSVINLLKANKPLVELYELRKEKSVQDVAYSTATAYFQVLVVKE